MKVAIDFSTYISSGEKVNLVDIKKFSKASRKTQIIMEHRNLYALLIFENKFSIVVRL